MDFRSRLRDEIEYSGLLYKEVASRAGITKSTMDSYVGAKASLPSVDVAVRLAQVLGVSVEYLVTGNNPGQKQLSEQEQRLLSHFKKLSTRERNALEQYIILLTAHEQLPASGYGSSTNCQSTHCQSLPGDPAQDCMALRTEAVQV